MKKSRLTEEQIAYALRQAEAGTPVGDVCRQLGVSEATFYVWKKKFASLGVTELPKLRMLEEENARPKRVVADLALDRHILQEVLRKKFEAGAPPRARALDSQALRGECAAGVPACVAAPLDLVSAQPCPRIRRRCAMRIGELALNRPRFGYLRIHVLLRREGWLINRKRVHRLYRLDGLQVRMRVRRCKRLSSHRGPMPTPTAVNQHWSVDFVHDQLLDGRSFRILTVIDQWSRDSVSLESGFSLTGASIVAALDAVAQRRPLPKAITVDHGTEFMSRALDERQCGTLGHPRQGGYVASC